MDEERTGFEKRGIGVAAMGSALIGTGVGLGAFGAHTLKKLLSESLLSAYKTGVEYQMYHGLALLAIGILIRSLATEAVATSFIRVKIAISRLFTGSILLLIGTMIFSGTLYIYSLADLRIAAMITPIGGVSFILGWIVITLALIQMRRSS